MKIIDIDQQVRVGLKREGRPDDRVYTAHMRTQDGKTSAKATMFRYDHDKEATIVAHEFSGVSAYRAAAAIISLAAKRLEIYADLTAGMQARYIQHLRDEYDVASGSI